MVPSPPPPPSPPQPVEEVGQANEEDVVEDQAPARNAGRPERTRRSMGKRLPTPVITEEEEREAAEIERQRLRQFEPPEPEPEEEDDEDQSGGEGSDDNEELEEPEDDDGSEHTPSPDDGEEDEQAATADDDRPLFKPLPKPSSKTPSRRKRKPPKPRSKPSADDGDGGTAGSRRKAPGGNIELTTYRIEKIAGQTNPHSRAGFNPYDIVRQLFCELAANYAATKVNNGKLETSAIESFERELDTRFVELVCGFLLFSFFGVCCGWFYL